MNWEYSVYGGEWTFIYMRFEEKIFGAVWEGTENMSMASLSLYSIVILELNGWFSRLFHFLYIKRVDRIQYEEKLEVYKT